MELSTLEKEKTHKLTLELVGNDPTADSRGTISILITITGTNVTESTSINMSKVGKKYVSYLVLSLSCPLWKCNIIFKHSDSLYIVEWYVFYRA